MAPPDVRGSAQMEYVAQLVSIKTRSKIDRTRTEIKFDKTSTTYKKALTIHFRTEVDSR